MSTNKILLLRTTTDARPQWVPQDSLSRPGPTQRLGARSAQELQRMASPSGPGNKPNRERISSLHSGASQTLVTKVTFSAFSAFSAYFSPNPLPASWGREKTKFDHLDKTKDLAQTFYWRLDIPACAAHLAVPRRKRIVRGLRALTALKAHISTRAKAQRSRWSREPRIHPLRSRPLRNNSERRARLQPCRKWRG